MKSLDLNLRLAHSCGVMEAWVMESAFEHDRAGMGCLGRVQFRKRMDISYYGNTMMYANLYGDKDLD